MNPFEKEKAFQMDYSVTYISEKMKPLKLP